MDKSDLSVMWEIYEKEKSKIAEENLTPEEYTKKIVELCNQLQI